MKKFEFFSLDYSTHFIGERVYAGAPFNPDDDGIFRIIHCYPGGCNGETGTLSNPLRMKVIGTAGSLYDIDNFEYSNTANPEMESKHEFALNDDF